MRRSRLLLPALLFVLTAALMCTDAALAAPTLSLAGEGDLTVEGSGGDTASTEMVVVNPGDAVPIEVEFLSSTEGGAELVGAEPEEAAKGATMVKVTFSGLSHLGGAQSGALVVKGGAAPLVRQTKVIRGIHRSANWPVIFVVGAFVAMLLLLLAILLKSENSGVDTFLRKKAPGPKWSFSSWATTLTAVGGILGTVVASATYPSEPIEISKDSLVSLTLLFAAMVVIGPFIFQAIRNSSATAADQEAGLWGYSWALLISCAITCGAVLGELACLGLLIQELITGEAWAVVALLAVAVLGLLALRYFWLTAWSLATTDWEQAVTDEKAKAAIPPLVRLAGNGELPMEFLGVAGGEKKQSKRKVAPPEAEASVPPPQLRSWSLP